MQMMDIGTASSSTVQVDRTMQSGFVHCKTGGQTRLTVSIFSRGGKRLKLEDRMQLALEDVASELQMQQHITLLGDVRDQVTCLKLTMKCHIRCALHQIASRLSSTAS